MAKKKYQKDPDAKTLVSPAGQLLYPYIMKPDDSVWSGKVKSDKKSKKTAKYKTGLLLSADEKSTKALIDDIKALYAIAKDRATAALKEKYPKKKKFETEDYEEVGGKKKLPYKELKDEAGEKTGDVQFSFNKKAYYLDKEKKFQPLTLTVQDKNCIPIMGKKINVGSGTLAKISFTATPFFNPAVGYGVSLQMEGVQILKLEEFKAGGQKTAAELGFVVEEEGEFSVDDLADADTESSEDEETETSSSESSDADEDDTDDGDDDEESDDF